MQELSLVIDFAFEVTGFDTVDLDRVQDLAHAAPLHADVLDSGKSGNPKGRPKGSKNLKTLIREEFLKPVTVVEKGKSIKIPRIRAIVRKVTVDALTGGHQEAKLALNTFAKCDDTADAGTIVELMSGQTAFELTPEEYEIITKLKLADGAD